MHAGSRSRAVFRHNLRFPMLIVYSEEHRQQDGRAELTGGKLVPCFEKPERADIVLDRVRAAGLGEVVAPDRFGKDPLLRVHAPDFVDFLETAWTSWTADGRSHDALPLTWLAPGMRRIRPTTIDGLISYYSFDAGTPITDGTWAAATASADVALSAAARITAGDRVSFGLCRPPGHHAGSSFYGGYCFLNNAAVAAQWLRDRGAGRVAVLDVDYHHGNGTQEIFYGRGDVLFVSIHADTRQEYPFFLGHADETGEGAGEGANLNLPLAWGSGWDAYEAALAAATARIRSCAPDLR
ncbi:MAG TPA: histone deacetylase family protein, partial [Arenibaculum sp.]|nr:histone deacetylase family protein [Arenibaculum sp.]